SAPTLDIGLDVTLG
ncbi:hypothetical protein, partial [Thalassospira sp. CH_XMU1420-2]